LPNLPRLQPQPAKDHQDAHNDSNPQAQFRPSGTLTKLL